MTVIKLIPSKDPEIRSYDQTIKISDRTIEGYVFKWDTESNLIDNKFYEVIRKGALTNADLRNMDITATYKDENSIPLARYKKGKGTLSLVVDSVGLYFRFKAKQTVKGNEILESISNKDITNTSFTFSVEPSGNKFTVKDHKSIREIFRIKTITNISLTIGTQNEKELPTVKTRNKEQVKETNLLDIYYLDYQEIIKNLKH